MGWIADSVEEFRKLPPAGKIAVSAAAVGVAILGYVAWQNNAANSAAAANTGTVTGAFPGALGATTTTSVSDPAGGSWSIAQPSFGGLYNGTGLPNRTVNAPPAPTSGGTLATSGPFLSGFHISAPSTGASVPVLTYKPL